MFAHIASQSKKSKGGSSGASRSNNRGRRSGHPFVVASTSAKLRENKNSYELRESNYDYD